MPPWSAPLSRRVLRGGQAEIAHRLARGIEPGDVPSSAIKMTAPVSSTPRSAWIASTTGVQPPALHRLVQLALHALQRSTTHSQSTTKSGGGLVGKYRSRRDGSPLRPVKGVSSVMDRPRRRGAAKRSAKEPPAEGSGPGTPPGPDERHTRRLPPGQRTLSPGAEQ